jgi:hypothetical protein
VIVWSDLVITMFSSDRMPGEGDIWFSDLDLHMEGSEGYSCLA